MLVLMRHGQASFGAAHYDRLSALGIEQARMTGSFLRVRGERCAGLWVGPRERHRATASALIDEWGVACALRNDEDLDEFADSTRILDSSQAAGIVVASPEQGSKLHRLVTRIGAWASGQLVLDGCPTLPEFRERVGRWIRRELCDGNRDATTMAVTSGGVVAAAMCEVMGLPDAMFLPLVSQVRNASLTGFAISRGRSVVVSFNGTLHLSNDLVTAI